MTFESATWRLRISMVQNLAKYIFVYILYILYTLYNAQTFIFHFPSNQEELQDVIITTDYCACLVIILGSE